MYQRLGGVRYRMGAYDYYHKRFRGHLSSSKSGTGSARFRRWVHGKYPSGGRII